MKYCSNCGKELNDEMSFCPSCGNQVNASIIDDREKIERSITPAAKKPEADKVLFIASCISIAIIFISLFLPYVTIEVFGTRTVNRLIQGDGIIFIILLLVILISIIMKKDIPYFITSFFVCLFTIFEVNSFSRKIMEINTSEDNLFNIDYSNLIQKDSGYYFLILGVLLHAIVIIAKAIIKKSKATTIFLIVSLSVITVISGIITYCKKPDVKYSIAKTLFETGNYRLSALLYSSIGNYEDAKERGMEALCASHYKSGKNLMRDGKYDEALEEFDKAGEFQDSADMIKSCYYEKGAEAFNNGDSDTALECLLSAGKNDEVNELRIKVGISFTENGEYDKAIEAFESQQLDDEAKKYQAYSRAIINSEKGKYQEATEYFTQAKDIFDAKEKCIEAHYKCGIHLMEEKKYPQAKLHFDKIPEYKDSKEMSEACRILEVKNYIDEGQLNKAKEELEKLPDGLKHAEVSTEGLKKILDDNEKWLKICGKWMSTGGTIKTRQEGLYGYYNEWFRDIKENEYSIEIRCIPKPDGKVLVKCNAGIFVFTNYSSIKEYLEGENINISGASEMTDYSSFEAGKNTTITLGESSIKLSYKKKEDNYAGFDDIYTTDITYGNRVTAY